MKNKGISRRDFLKGSAAGAVGIAAAGLLGACSSSDEKSNSTKWDYEADVVIIGAGGAGLPAGLKAMEDGASVLFVEANWDCGGHAAVSGGNLHFGGGTAKQKAFGVEDSADKYYLDHTEGQPMCSRWNDREYVRAIADSMVPCYDLCIANGLKETEDAPIHRNYFFDDPTRTEVESVARQTNTDMVTDGWENIFTGVKTSGIGITRPLEKSLREKGAQFLMNYHMDKFHRDEAGRVIGLTAHYTPTILPGETDRLESFFSEGNLDCTKETINVKAKKGVIIATGGSTGNENFRTMIDPRLGPEFDGLGGMPFSDQDASGELAAMEIGGALGVMAGYAPDDGGWLTTPSRFGCRYGYNAAYSENSKIWKLFVAKGVSADIKNSIIVNMVGNRCGNEDMYDTNKYTNFRFEFFKTALSSVVVDPNGDGNARRYGGPLWAIYDQDTVVANDWDMNNCDFENGYAFKADTLTELAQKIVNKYYEHIKMDPANLVKTVADWNSYVENGEDKEWGRKNLNKKIQNGPFYALWAVPSLHDTLAGLRVNSDMQCVNIHGELIPGLFCVGEASAGMRVHGLGRVMVSGYIAGRSVASIDENGNVTNHSLKSAEPIANELQDFDPSTENDLIGGNAQNAGQEAAGTFTGTSENGMNGAIKLEITVEDGKMTAIEILEQKETENIGVPAFDTLIKQALETQSANVDTVSGATVTTEAFKEALKIAMEKAGL